MNLPLIALLESKQEAERQRLQRMAASHSPGSRNWSRQLVAMTAEQLKREVGRG